jgi:transposase
MPDWPWAHAELRRPGVTLALLRREYRLSHSQGFQYSWFCEHYRLWGAKVDVVMRHLVRSILEVAQRIRRCSTKRTQGDLSSKRNMLLSIKGGGYVILI